jgi:hypothetical protein
MHGLSVRSDFVCNPTVRLLAGANDNRVRRQDTDAMITAFDTIRPFWRTFR